MVFIPPQTTIGSLPHEFDDKCGRKLHLRMLDDSLHQPLLEMYLAFQPRNCFQGLPPIRDEVCAQWVRDMVRNGTNLVAVAPHSGPCATAVAAAAQAAVLGHAALFSIDQYRCEMLVVVSSSSQNLGLGTELVQGSVRAARELGFERIWLPVAATNVRARHVYEKCGFQYVSRGLSRELEMACELESIREPVTALQPEVAHESVHPRRDAAVERGSQVMSLRDPRPGPRGKRVGAALPYPRGVVRAPESH
jgi:diamine N-acetyltransferase